MKMLMAQASSVISKSPSRGLANRTRPRMLMVVMTATAASKVAPSQAQMRAAFPTRRFGVVKGGFLDVCVEVSLVGL